MKSSWCIDRVNKYLLEERNGEYILISSFEGMNSDISLKHVVCNNAFNVIAGKFIYQKSVCPVCSRTKKLTNEEFLLRIKNINKNILPLEDYKGANTRIKYKCLIDGYEWTTTPACIFNGQGCPKCVKRHHRTALEFADDLFDINPDIGILGKYINMKSKILVECKLDGYIWEVVPFSLLNGIKCPRCSGVERYSTEDFIKKFKNFNSDIEILGDYINVDTKIQVRCLIDGFT